MDTRLMVSPSYFEVHSNFVEAIERALAERDLIFHASVLLDRHILDEHELERAILKSIATLLSARIPAAKHFKIRLIFLLSHR